MNARAMLPVLLLALAMPAAAIDTTGSAPPDGTIGLLETPTLFGSGSCTQRAGGKYPLRTAPSATAAAIGALEADPIAPGMNACSQDALAPRVRKNGDSWTSPAPTREFKSGHPGLIVIDSQPGWYRIQIGDDVAWLQTPPAALVHWYGNIVLLSPVHTLRGWDGRVCASPKPDTCRVMARPSNPALRIVRAQTFGSELWFQVEFGINACEGATPPGRDVLTGWIPAYGPQGYNGKRPLTLWMDPHGC